MIKAIIFDYGGVLTFGKYTAAILGAIEKRHKLSPKGGYEAIDGLIQKLELRKISAAEFVKGVNEELKSKISLGEMRRILGEAIRLNPDVIGLVDKLRRRYRAILLSNNNDMTIKILRTRHGKVLGLFEKIYFSSEVGLGKPSKEFFEYALRDAGLKPSECLFIDDKEKNVRAAEKLGMKGIVFESAAQLEKGLARLGIKAG